VRKLVRAPVSGKRLVFSEECSVPVCADSAAPDPAIGGKRVWDTSREALAISWLGLLGRFCVTQYRTQRFRQLGEYFRGHICPRTTADDVVNSPLGYAKIFGDSHSSDAKPVKAAYLRNCVPAERWHFPGPTVAHVAPMGRD
jgi:hypothetical protein